MRLLPLIALLAAGPALAAEPADLAALLAEAEASHPELAALAARREAARQVPSQMEALPDPTVSLSYTNEGLDSLTLGSMPDSNLTVNWTQELPWPGKRRLAGEVARGEVTAAEREIDAARIRIRADVKRAWLELHRIDRTLEVLEETRRVLSSLVQAARARYESGEGPLENVLKAGTELTAVETEVAMNRQERRATEAMLAAALGRPGDASFGPVAGLPEVPPPDREAILRQAAEASPEIRVLQAQSDLETRRLDLARRNLKPDLMYGVGYTERAGLEPMVMGMVGARLPLFRARKQAAAVTQTEFAVEAARREVDAARNEVAAEVRDLLAVHERAVALQPLYAQALIPQARSTLDAATGAYAAGTADFMALLDDALKLLQYEIAHENQRVDGLQALVALERITGTEIVVPAGAAR